MREFTCPKCEHGGVYVKHHTKLNTRTKDFVEKLACECCRCDYKWEEEPSVAEKPKE